MSDPSRSNKIPWKGGIVSVQPRIRMRRHFDQRDHSYPGFVLGVKGTLGSNADEHFLVALGQGAQTRHQFRVGDIVSGVSVPVEVAELETAGYYKTSGLKVIERPKPLELVGAGPPFQGVPPDLKTYRAKGHRRLDAETYTQDCATCIWGCRMPVEIVRDNWNRSRGPHNVTRQFETFCYGPAECAFYKAGPLRKVQGRKPGMIHEDDGDSRSGA